MDQIIQNLPIYPFLDEICQTLKDSPSRFLVLTAETAAGKSTAVPLALLQHFSGKILMLEPRRLAATAIADRLSFSLGEETGKTVGYRLHLDSKVSKDTRLEVVTEAILTRRLQNDPLLEDINVIILDEFHERSIHSDLALAFLKETMALRDDLYIIVMSATIDYHSIAEYLGSKTDPAPVMQIPGRQFPVQIDYWDNCSIPQAVTKILTNDSCLDCKSGSILVFLPGIYEINRTKSELEQNNLQSETEILILHSSVPLSEQRKVLQPSTSANKRRVILSSAIAETSLTVPDVTVVIDSGLCRTNKMNLSVGMERLVTENESMFSADQRAGRAGRIQAGHCIRLWNKNDVRILKNEPEILRADLTQLVLECAQWGVSDKTKLSWLDEPADSSWNTASELLSNLDLIKEGQITKRGQAALKLGLHPRLANVALNCGKSNLSPVIRFSEYADASPERKKRFEEDLIRRLSSISLEEKSSTSNPILAGFPDRLAKLLTRNTDQAEYQFPSGRKAILKKDTLLQMNKKLTNDSCLLSDFPSWIVAPEVDAGSNTARIYSFETLSDTEAEDFLSKHTQKIIKSEFADGNLKSNQIKILKRELTCYGNLIIKETKLNASSEDFSAAVCNLVKEKGLNQLPLDSKTINFLLRVEFYSNNQPDSQDTIKTNFSTLQENASEWLSPFINGNKIDSEIIYNALYWYLNGSLIDEKVPSQILLTNGRKVKVNYERQNSIIKPVIEVIIQRVFGCFETPQIMGQPVLLKLLSPASRPLQITEDLANFWTQTWPEICKEMKGRYPKHNWDYRVVVED